MAEKSSKEPVYVALGVKPDGQRQVLGFWLFGAEGESSQNWKTILRELWDRGVRKVEVFISDDLPGIEEAIREVFPNAKWQLCVVHAVRDALAKVRKANRDAMTQDLKRIYRADTSSKPTRPWRRSSVSGRKSTRRSWPNGHKKARPCWSSSTILRPSGLNLHYEPAGATHKGSEKEGEDSSGGIL